MKDFTKILLTAVCGIMCIFSAGAQTKSWKFVTTGDATTYAINNDGTLWAWGWNESGQLGIGGGNEKVSTPMQIGTENNWKSASAGQAYAFFIKEDGTLWHVGDNSDGCSGVGDGAANHKEPVQVGTDTDWQQVACTRFFGHAVLAIKTDGTLWAWGQGSLGSLGLGNYNSQATPVQVGNDNDWQQVSVGSQVTLAVKKDGTLWGWGFNDRNQLMTAETLVKTPLQLGTDTDWRQVFAVYNTMYGVKTDGTLWVWGDNDGNKAGINDPDLTTIDTPTQITAITGKVQFISGCDNNRVVGVGDNGVATKLYAWGSNADGGLGNGTGVAADQPDNISIEYAPVEVALEEDIRVTQLASGISYSVVLADDGTIYGWGKNRGGQLGNLCSEDKMTFCPEPITCTVESVSDEKTYTFGPDEIPANLSDAKKLVLTGTWGTSDFGKLSVAIGNNTGFPPVGNSTIEEIDMSRAMIAEGASTYVPVGFNTRGTFYGLNALKTFRMPEAEEAARLTNINEMFWNCPALEEIDLTGCVNVTKMNSTFYGCAALTSADLSKCENITTSESLFDHCTSLTEVKLPATITLSKYAFAYCSSLKTIDWSLYTGTEAPDFAENLFQNLTDLKAITLIVPEAAVDVFKAHADWSALNIVAASTTGIGNIVSDKAHTGEIFTVGGKYAGKDRNALRSGIYIINGRKVIVK